MNAPGRGLEELEARLRRDLDLLNYPPDNWVAASGDSADAPMLDVLIVGAGMCGLSAAFALLRRGVRNLRVIDSGDAGREGPWLRYARMQTLRSPKHIAGPALGLPNLTFRAWFEAQFGACAWEALGRIPRVQWMDYLRWYRRVMALPVDNNVAATDIRAGDPGLVVSIEDGSGRSELHARKVVLATGREGMAVPRVPAPLRRYLGARCQHSSEAIDFAALRGKRVAVVGLGASAFDNAGVALEAGAASVTIVARAGTMPRVNKAKGIVYDGFTEGFPSLPPQLRLRLLSYIFECRIPPPRDSVLRVTRHTNARVLLGAPIGAATLDNGELVLSTPRGRVAADHVILGTGFRIDIGAAPELAGVADAIATYRDHLHASGADADSEMLDFPWLAGGFEFTEKYPGSAPMLAHVHCFNFAAALSHGNVSGDIPAVSEGAERLARAIAGGLFATNADAYWQALQQFNDPELRGDELPDS